jgi:hypothetical protein
MLSLYWQRWLLIIGTCLHPHIVRHAQILSQNLYFCYMTETIQRQRLHRQLCISATRVRNTAGRLQLAPFLSCIKLLSVCAFMDSCCRTTNTTSIHFLWWFITTLCPVGSRYFTPNPRCSCSSFVSSFFLRTSFPFFAGGGCFGGTRSLGISNKSDFFLCCQQSVIYYMFTTASVQSPTHISTRTFARSHFSFSCAMPQQYFYLTEQPDEKQRKAYKNENRYILPNPLTVALLKSQGIHTSTVLLILVLTSDGIIMLILSFIRM